MTTTQIISGSRLYSAIPGDFEPFSSSTYYTEFRMAQQSPDLLTAESRWESIVGEGDWDNDKEFADLSDHTLYAASVIELVRVYYLLGKASERDKLLNHLLLIGISKAPSETELFNLCADENF